MANLLGFEIFNGTKKEYMDKLMDRYKNGEKTVIISGNPEVLYSALNNNKLMALCLESSIIPDGVGVILAGKITGQSFKQKIAGIEVMEELLKLSGTNNIKVYLLGAEEYIVEKAAQICRERYGAHIAGYHNGFFDMNNCEDIIEDIRKSGAHALFVAMGCPRQEFFIERYKDVLNAKIFMGVGGSFDVIAGKVNRAPKWMINIGMEWLYRVSKEPNRIIRLMSIPKFLMRAIIAKK